MNGTRVEVRLGDALPFQDGDLDWAELAIQAAGSEPIYRGNSSPYWYDQEALFELF